MSSTGTATSRSACPVTRWLERSNPMELVLFSIGAALLPAALSLVAPRVDTPPFFPIAALASALFGTLYLQHARRTTAGTWVMRSMFVTALAFPAIVSMLPMFALTIDEPRCSFLTPICAAENMLIGLVIGFFIGLVLLAARTIIRALAFVTARVVERQRLRSAAPLAQP